MMAPSTWRSTSRYYHRHPGSRQRWEGDGELLPHRSQGPGEFPDDEPPRELNLLLGGSSPPIHGELSGNVSSSRNGSGLERPPLGHGWDLVLFLQQFSQVCNTIPHIAHHVVIHAFRSGVCNKRMLEKMALIVAQLFSLANRCGWKEVARCGTSRAPSNPFTPDEHVRQMEHMLLKWSKWGKWSMWHAFHWCAAFHCYCCISLRCSISPWHAPFPWSAPLESHMLHFTVTSSSFGNLLFGTFFFSGRDISSISILASNIHSCILRF